MTHEAQEYYHKKLLSFPDAAARDMQRDLSNLANLVPEKTTVHMIGICGKGTATVAGLLKEKGFIVSGSDDTFYPPVGLIVENLGVKIFRSFDAANVTGADVVIVGNACTPTHVEVLAAKEQGILQISMSEALEYFFLHDKKNIVVAGTHGKTTLTGMISWLLEHAGLDPLYFIGGVIQGNTESHRFSRGAYAVLEGDEYDTAYFDKGPKFLHYKPWCGIITSCELDHSDIYSSFEEYQQAFIFLIKEINPTGFLIVHESVYAILKNECDAFTGTCIVYGQSPAAPYHVSDFMFSETTSSATITKPDGTDTLSIKLPGAYNLENALVAYIVGTQCCGIDHETVKTHLATFPGMERRQQELFRNDKYVFLDDFAHHPTAVKVTLDGIRGQHPDKRIVCLFEPRSNSSRKKMFEEPYSQAFGSADVVFICAPELRWNDKSEDFVDIGHIVSLLKTQGKEAFGFTKASEVFEGLKKLLKPGDLIVTMSNGSFDNIQADILTFLKDA
jgi:UDP-N-acetylmuramate: L-alanyl-gamma-D-glutamyl-meso-diaminopimelate ligase